MKMKILLNSHPIAFQNPGGAELKVRNVKAYLEKRGYAPEVFYMFKHKIDDFDVVHNFTMNIDCFTFCNLVHSKKVPLALSTIYWDMSEINKRGTKVNFNDRIISVGSATLNALSKLDQKTLKLFDRADILARLYPYQRYMKIADVLLPNSYAEADILKRKFKADPRKIRVVHNAVESHFSDADRSLFIERYGWKDFVLFVGRIDYRKNLLPLIKACNELGYELVIIGSPAGDTDTRYYDLCKKAAGKRTHFLPGMPYGSDMLKSAYAAAYTIALPSWFETPGNTVMEGGLAGANVVTTGVGSGREYFGDLALYVDPASYEDIKDKIKQSMEMSKSLKIRHHLMKNFTWEKHADKTLKAYKEIIR